ncbi:hypothetical protein LNTAR_20288 [Lentisphaera araneosa HTCC2155]|jgi:predicted SprT family Zn-dependent metalloprotease|uniref:SprT-like domain-containing protein n=1 Tax=Lentisphaera araneosa HTCC2155 TaxID=313628 RepID=A6DKY0_9BACT|nr:DUF2786 domain-containing protein [Lentisphaera araneosa]EDM27582.1 hypothetical protein LNTAR_20288 [Lentisphaera araneosa HTCC2155]
MPKQDDHTNIYRAWYMRLQEHAEGILKNYALSCPTLSISNKLNKTLGHWSKSKNEICLAETIFYEFPWDQVLHVFKHELAHMIADLAYQGSNETSHGPSFKKACSELGISSEASLRNPQKHSSLNNKINKLLALSKSSNQHEATNAAIKAQALMDKYNHNLHEHNFSFRSIGTAFKRCPMWHSQIINICSRYFYVKVLKNYSNREEKYFFEFYGELQNIATAEYIYNFLYSQGQSLWKEYKKAGQRREQFLLGLYEGFESSLKHNKHASQNSLIHLRNPALLDFFTSLNPRTRSISYKYKIDPALYKQGQQIGRKLKIPKSLSKKTAQKRLN